MQLFHFLMQFYFHLRNLIKIIESFNIHDDDFSMIFYDKSSSDATRYPREVFVMDYFIIITPSNRSVL